MSSIGSRIRVMTEWHLLPDLVMMMNTANICAILCFVFLDPIHLSVCGAGQSSIRWISIVSLLPISAQIMEIAGKGGFACYNFNGICMLKLERGVVGGGRACRDAGTSGCWAAVCCTNRQGLSTGHDGWFWCGRPRGPDEGLHVFLDPDHNGQLLPAGRKLQPLRNVTVIIFPSSYKIEDVSKCKSL